MALLDSVQDLIGETLYRNVYTNTHKYNANTAKNIETPERIKQQIKPRNQDTLLDFNNKMIGDPKKNNLYNSEPFSATKGKYAQLSQIPAPSQARFADVTVTAHWMRNIVRELGIPVPLPVPNDKAVNAQRISKGIDFLATQFLLTSLNPGDPEVGGPANKIWNPLSLTAAIPFLSTDLTNITIAAAASSYKFNTQITVSTNQERLLKMRNGTYVEFNPQQQLMQLRKPNVGFRGDIAKTGEYDSLEKPGLKAFSISDQVDGGPKTLAASKAGVYTNLYTPENPYGPDNAKNQQRTLNSLVSDAGQSDPAGYQFSKFFVSKPFPGGPPIPPSLGPFAAPAYTFVAKHSLNNIPIVDNDSPGIYAGVTDAKFSNDLEESEYIASKELSDDQIYLPLMFQDLRDKPPKFLYFRAFLQSGLAETFTPDWQVDRYYGRVDQIPTYQGTIRDVSFGFDVVAWSYNDLEVIWYKLKKLQSMVYPSYTEKTFLKAGPIIRLRIGDLIAGENNKGLPGYITAMDWSYDDGIWEIEKDKKIPRKISVTISYTVLHDGNPGIYPYREAQIFGSGDINTLPSSNGGSVFGAAKFESDKYGDTHIVVSPEEIRKIFKSRG